MTAAVNRSVCLRDEKVLFLIAGEILDLIGDATVVNFAIRRFNETELIDPREGRHRADETDVWTFRRFDRTNPAVVRRAHVADFKSRTIPAQSAWPERRQTALVRQLGERIRLIHELRELRPTEEITDDCAQRLGIYQFLRRHTVDIDVEQGHPLLH